MTFVAISYEILNDIIHTSIRDLARCHFTYPFHVSSTYSSSTSEWFAAK